MRPVLSLRFLLVLASFSFPALFLGSQEGGDAPLELERPAAPEAAKTREPGQELLYDGQGLPRLHLYDGEETSLLSLGSSRTVVAKADGAFVRNLYDGDYRLQSRLTWSEGAAADGLRQDLAPAELRLQEEFFYYGDSRARQRVVLTDFQGMSRRESFYSMEGLLTREEVYRPRPAGGPEREQLSGEGPSSGSLPNGRGLPDLALAQRTEYEYDQEGALVEKRAFHHGEHEGLVQRTLYHTPGNVLGGYDYFENGSLLVSRKYEDESVYTETRHFGNMRVEARYDGARLVSEVVYLDGRELRRAEY